MNKKFISFQRSIIVSLVSILVLSGLYCKKDPGLFRFIDHVDEVEVLKSPIRDMEKKIELLKQEWSEKDMFPFDFGGNTYFAVRTQGHLLGWDESKPPREVELFRDGEKIEFSNLPSKNSLAWRWLRVEKTFNPIKMDELLDEMDSFELADDEEYEISGVYLPDGEYIVDIWAGRGDEKQYLPYLEFLIDGNLVDKFPVENGIHRFVVALKTGVHDFKIIHNGNKILSGYKGNPKLRLNQMKIELIGDLILLSNPDLQPQKDHRYEIEYRSYSKRTMINEDSLFAVEGGRFGSGYSIKNRGEIEGNIDLPGGDCQIEINSYSSPEGGFLTFWLDGQKIERKWILVDKRKSYFFKVKNSPGRHRIKFRFEKLDIKRNYPDLRCYIGGMLILQMEDSNTTAVLEIMNERKYRGDDSEFKSSWISRKIRVGKYYLNTLLAPADSNLAWDIIVPKKGILEFGCGVLDIYQSHGIGDEELVEFSVYLESEKQPRKKLFSDFIQMFIPSESSAYPPVRKIDLSDYQGKRVRIYFSTKNKSGKKNGADDINEKLGMSFWVNPVLYQNPVEKIEKKEDVNIILISIDTLRSDHLGCYGYVKDTSPYLDKFCSDSVLFMNNYSHSPSTLPSHMTMLTSLYPYRHKLIAQKSGFLQKLDIDISLVSQILREEDYFTTAIVDGGYVGTRFGFSRGFDIFFENTEITKKNNLSGRLFKRSSDWIKKNSDKKFFLFLHTYQVHTPYASPDPYNLMFYKGEPIWKWAHIESLLAENGGFNKYKKFSDKERENLIALYDGCIRYTDEEFFKPLLQLLRDLKIYDRTMIIFTADHGEEFYEHGSWGHTHSLYNELIKVPLIIKFPGSEYQGKKVEPVSRIVDIVPTILEAAGIDIEKFSFDGESLIPYITKKKSDPRESPGFKYIYQDQPNEPIKIELKNVSLVEGCYKVILNYKYASDHYLYKDPDIFPFPVFQEEYYNLKEDKSEIENRIDNPEFGFRSVFEKIREWNRIAKEIEHEQVVFDSYGQELRERLRALGYVH